MMFAAHASTRPGGGGGVSWADVNLVHTYLLTSRRRCSQSAAVHLRLEKVLDNPVGAGECDQVSVPDQLTLNHVANQVKEGKATKSPPPLCN